MRPKLKHERENQVLEFGYVWTKGEECREEDSWNALIQSMFFTILAIRSLLIISYIGRMGLSLTSTIFELKTSHED